jgi:hypothetical protein
MLSFFQQAYDAYIDKTKKELEDKKDYSTDTSLPSGKVWNHDYSEHDAEPAGDSGASSTRKKLFKHKDNKYEEDVSRTGSCELTLGSGNQPQNTSALMEMRNCVFQVSHDDTNVSTQLRESSQSVADVSHMSENSSIQTFLSGSLNKDDLEDEKDLEDVLEELEEQSKIESVIEEEVQDGEGGSELNSTVHNQNSGPTVQELLYEKPESKSVIQELLVSQQQSSVQEIETAEEMESIPEEVSKSATTVEENKDWSESLETDLQDAGQQSCSVLNHSEERAISSVSSIVSSLKDSVQLGTHSTPECKESDDIEGDTDAIEEIPEAEEEVGNIPETKEGLSESEEDIPKAEVSNSLNAVLEVADILIQESDHNCDVNYVKEKADEGISGKIERITDIIFQKLLNESLKTLCRKDTKYNKSAMEVFNRNEYETQSTEETGKEADLINQSLDNNYENDSFMTTDKSNKNKHMDRVDNITNAIIEQLLAESSMVLYSKKSKMQNYGNVYEDSASTHAGDASTRSKAVTGN